MNNKLQQILEHLIPFIMLGIAIAFAVGLLMMFFYVVIWGIIIGGFIWLVVFIKNYFFPHQTPKNSEGHIIEHKDQHRD